jgi:hypothetical protein
VARVSGRAVREIRDASIAAPDQAPMTTLGRRQTIAVPLEVDSNGRGAALGLSVKYRFDVVSLGLEDATTRPRYRNV